MLQRSEPKSKEVIEDSDSSDDEVKEVDPTDPDTVISTLYFVHLFLEFDLVHILLDEGLHHSV